MISRKNAFDMKFSQSQSCNFFGTIFSPGIFDEMFDMLLENLNICDISRIHIMLVFVESFFDVVYDQVTKYSI